MPDTMTKTRFTAANFHVGFACAEGQRILVHSVSPTDLRGAPVNIHRTSTSDASLTTSVGYSAVSASIDAGKSDVKEWNEDTTSRVRGHGENTPEAYWTFQENEIKGGLETSYELTVSHSMKFGDINMSFWAEAKLESRGLISWERWMTMGSRNKPLLRQLDVRG